ncbi:MarR family transcriptional regulator [Bdellovibrio bacteriovorus]|uniref:MarR family transcriptional regulator n=1 Tax=Bdellovibrio bacteriovorus TaxID=959 RepID=UPI0035A5D5B7
MKQKNRIIYLKDFTADSTPWGTDQGQAVYAKLQKELNKFPDAKIVGISLRGIERIDVSFSRESIVNLAKSKRGEIGFYLKDIKGRDHVENINSAAKAKDQPLIVFEDSSFEVVGPDLNLDTRELLRFIMDKGTVTTSVVVKKFDISTPNASAKLKKLLNQGLIIGAKEPAETGGLEYVFSAIK